MGGWTWYAWFGSVPHPHFSVRFEDTDRAYSGAAQLIGKDQIVFLHGGTLARYDLKTKKPVWSLELVTKDQIAAIVKLENDLRTRENQLGGYGRVPPPGSQEREAKIELQGELSLHVSGQNIWIAKPDNRERDELDFKRVFKLTRYDWDAGKVLQEVLLTNRAGLLAAQGNEFVMLERTNTGVQWVTHISMANGESRTEEFHDPGTVAVASAGGASGSSRGSATDAGGGQPSDAQKLAEQARNLNLPGRIALPALLANEIHQQQIKVELKDNNPSRPKPENARKPSKRSRPFHARSQPKWLYADRGAFARRTHRHTRGDESAAEKIRTQRRPDGRQ